MQLRSWINDNANVAAIFAVVALAVGGAWFYLTGAAGLRRNDPARAQVWFYDVGAAKLFAAPSDAVPPIEAPSGGEGVRAHVMSCGDCTADHWYIAYLQKFTPEVKAELEQNLNSPHPVFGIERAEASMLVSRPNPIEWVPATSGEADEIFLDAANRCEHGRAHMCGVK